MTKSEKFQMVHTLITESLHDPKMVSFETTEEQMEVVFNDSWAVKNVASILCSIGLLVSSYIDYDKNTKKIKAVIY